MAERAHPEDKGFKDKFFGLIKNKYKQKLYERYNFCSAFIKDKKILDIPCGVGWGTSLLEKANFVIGIDVSVEAIDYARKHYDNVNRKFYVAAMESIPFKNDSIDIIICLEGFEHITKDKGLHFIEEVKRILKAKGLLIISCPILDARGKPTGNPYHCCEYPEYELGKIFKDNFQISRLDKITGPDGPEYRAVLINIK